MKTRTDPTSELAPIARLLEKDEPKLVVVVGTGISIGATDASHASWLGLLKHGIRHLVETEVFTSTRGHALSATLERAFAPFDLESALQHAELVEQNLKIPDSAAFARWLKIAFSDLKVQAARSATLDAIRDLQQSGALLLTTNYDNLLTEATGLPPVTWEEHAAFFQVMRNPDRGVLHVHGHWERPSSVVLGRSSYDRIAQDQDFQDLFKELWLGRNWLYVGCGNGLGDPNLGRLLKWGERWKKDTPADYFLAQGVEANALASRPDQPANIVYVAYPDHLNLPGVLRSLTPSARCWPFSPVDADFALFRNPASPASIPFPSHQEYLDGAVPAFSADAEVRGRLEEHGWAFVLDVASVGKTTLALRMATAPMQRSHPAFYLDLAAVDADDAAAVSQALRRLTRPASLLILDNVHHEPELARQLWDQWRQRPCGSRLLLVATRMQRVVVTAPAQDLSFFEHHSSNPAIELRPTPGDLRDIIKHLYARIRRPETGALPDPPSSALQRWHQDYGNALGAFCLAALGRLAEFQRGHWDLPLESASDWVREKWLDPLDARNRENVLCLAVFGSQELELQVQNDALPHPGQTGQLFRLGLVAKTPFGQFGQYARLSLREPGWGALLLAAHVPAADEERILFETAARHPIVAIALNARMRRNRSFRQLAQLWDYLSSHSDSFVTLSADLPLSYCLGLVKAAKEAHKPQLANQLWDAIEREPDKLAERVWDNALQLVASFLGTAMRHERNTVPLWEALEREPDRLAGRAMEGQLGAIVSFLKTATRQHRNTEPLWEALERAPEKLVERAWDTPLGDVARFLDTAKRHQRNLGLLWDAFEREPHRFAERAWETSLGDIASFLDAAKRHERNVVPLWEAVEHEPAKLAECMWQAPLNNLAHFIDTAMHHQRNTAPLWMTIERDPEALAKRAWEAPLSSVACFLDTAKRHRRYIETLWTSIEREPTKFMERVWDTPLESIASFLDTAQRHGRNVAVVWTALESDRDRLVEHAWETSLEHIAFFLNTARRHNRDTGVLWAALEARPDRLAECVWEASLEHTASFLDVAKQHGRDTAGLCAILESRPDKLSERIWQTSLESAASFLDSAKQHGLQLEQLLKVLESRPEKIAEVAKRSSMISLAGFCHYAPDTLVKIALSGIHPSHWDAIPDSEALPGATWVAGRCGHVGRDDLKSSLISTLLRRANPHDFPPQSAGLRNVAWLLKQTTTADGSLVQAFVDTLCTSRWLGGQYTIAGPGALASGLRTLVLHQPSRIWRRFHNPSLGIRVQNELARFCELGQQEQSQVIQLFGSAILSGLSARRDWLDHVPFATISDLAVETLPHRSDVNRVEERQLGLWLGFRAVTQVTRRPLAVPAEVIARTLHLWRSNVVETSSAPQSAEHHLNVSMVKWLEASGGSWLFPPTGRDEILTG